MRERKMTWHGYIEGFIKINTKDKYTWIVISQIH